VRRLLAWSWEPRVNPPHPLDGIINRIPERVFPSGPAIQPRRSPNKEHSGDKIDQFLSTFVRTKDKTSSSF